MLITICYSVLTWIQNRKRSQVTKWIQDTCLIQGHSLMLVRSRSDSEYHQNLSASTGSLATCSSTLGQSVGVSPSSRSWSNVHLSSHISSLLGSSEEPRAVRVLWESPQTQAVVISPRHIVQLHAWTSWRHRPDAPVIAESTKINLVIEAEPGLVIDKGSYRKFSQFGSVVAWKCDAEFGIILHSSVQQVTELMHVYRLRDLVLEGGWRVYRITTASIEGTAGTLISSKGSSLISPGYGVSPGSLRQLSAGIYECTDSPVGTTPVNCLSKDTSTHKIPEITEDNISDIDESDDEVTTITPLLNWHERSPRKLSSPNVLQQRASTSSRAAFTLPRRKSRSGSLSEKSLSLASLLFCSKSSSPSRSLSVEERQAESPQEERPSSRELLDATVLPLPQKLKQSRSISVSTSAMDRCSVAPPYKLETIKKTSSSATKISSTKFQRTGKPPNILILCEDESMRQKIHKILNSLLSSDRYIIYEIRWDQLRVGGWADQTALLVLSGPIPESIVNLPILLQFLGDGGHLMAWCAESAPFGLPASAGSLDKGSVVYGSAQVHSPHLVVESGGWGSTPGMNSAPTNFPRIVETLDSEGTSRPLTASVIGKSAKSSQAMILQLDGGTLGGKAVLSRVHFEEIEDEVLLSFLLSTTLGLDCTRFKAPEYSPGFLLGDHTRILDFLSRLPSSPLEQRELTVEFVPHGRVGPGPSREVFPVHFFKCPAQFSTIKYFENLATRDLGRLVVYSDAITSVMNVLIGKPLQHGFTVIARQQTAGRGRGKNVWLSPEGSALFAFQLHLSRDSGIGRRLSLIQHITALAMILAVPQHQEISLRVKWPNDVYLGLEKVGGILVESVMEGQKFIVNIGVGFNVSNSYPTTSLNTALTAGPKSNKDGNVDPKWSPFSVEQYIASTLTQLEHLLDSVETGGLENVLKLYRSNWIHTTDDEVTVEVSRGNWATCRILSIDEFGFLRVCEVESSDEFSVQPDGNSFDIANRLISIK